MNSTAITFQNEKEIRNALGLPENGDLFTGTESLGQQAHSNFTINIKRNKKGEMTITSAGTISAHEGVQSGTAMRDGASKGLKITFSGNNNNGFSLQNALYAYHKPEIISHSHGTATVVREESLDQTPVQDKSSAFETLKELCGAGFLTAASKPFTERILGNPVHRRLQL